MTLTPIPATTLAHVEQLRQMRNATSEGFANFNGQVSPEQQIAWWKVNRGRVRAWLYEAPETETVTRLVSGDLPPSQRWVQALTGRTVLVGFGLIRQHDDGRWFTTVGVLSEHTGRDYGKEITHHLIAQVPGKCYGIARRDNPAAVKLHVARDWQAIEGPDPNLVYFRTWREGSLENCGPHQRRVDTWAGRTVEPWPPDGAVEEWSAAGWVTS